MEGWKNGSDRIGSSRHTATRARTERRARTIANDFRARDSRTTNPGGDRARRYPRGFVAGLI